MSPSSRHPNRRFAAVDLRRAAALATFGPHPFTRAQALAAGLSLHDLRSDAVRPLARGVFVAATAPATFATRCAGIALLLPEGGRLAGQTAAELHGFPIPHHDLVTLSVPQRTRFACSDAVIVRHHDAERGATKVWLPQAASRVPVTKPSLLLTECALSIPLVEAVVLADSILAQTGAQASTTLHAWREAPDRRVRRIGELSAIGVESSMESRTRVLLLLAGFPQPEVQLKTTIAGRVRRFDLGWPKFRVVVEYDGTYHFASEQQKHLDLIRAHECETAGWTVVRVVSVGIYRDPADTIARVAEALRSRGCPVQLSDEWREHFPQLAR